jgi:hypothetical protein
MEADHSARFIETHVPEYRGQNMYRPAFAAEIFRALVPGREGHIETYERLYSRGLLDS